MLKLLSSIGKELTLLYRDFAGLLVLFVMPVVLVVVVTLVQENVLKSMGEKKTGVLFIDLDHGKSVGRGIEDALRKSRAVNVVSRLKDGNIDVETAKRAVARGDYQLCIIVPEGMTEALRNKARGEGKRLHFHWRGKRERGAGTNGPAPVLYVYFDPALREAQERGHERLGEDHHGHGDCGRDEGLIRASPEADGGGDEEGHGRHVVR